MEGEIVVAAVEAGGAEAVADRVSEQVVVGDTVISAQVGAVEQTLVDHAAVSEERHEEILEEQAVCQGEQQLLMSQLTALQSSLSAFQMSTQATQAAMLAELQTLNGRLLTGSMPLIQQTPAVVEEEPPIVEAESVEEGPQEAPIKKRRVRVI